MNIILIGIPFFRSIGRGWLSYYNKSSGPKFTEEQIRMADEAAELLDDCHPITDFLGSETHFGICQSLDKKRFVEANKYLGKEVTDLTNADCLEALKVGIYLLGCTAPDTIRKATLNLLACDSYFPLV